MLLFSQQFLVKHEALFAKTDKPDAFRQRMILQKRADRGKGDLRRLLWRIAVNAGADGRKRQAAG
jgi:hypothetical protein